jgi:hypothetical protein
MKPTSERSSYAFPTQDKGCISYGFCSFSRKRHSLANEYTLSFPFFFLSYVRNLTIIPSDSGMAILKPQTISLGLSDNEIRPFHGQVAITLTVTLNADTVPGQYHCWLLRQAG